MVSVCSVFDADAAEIDRDTVASGEQVPLDLCLPSVEGTSNRPKSTYDDGLWACHLQGQFA